MTVTWNNAGTADEDAGIRAGSARAPERPLRVLIPFGTPFLYGMERGVIEIFDALRPEVEPEFVQSRAIFDERPPVIGELERRGLPFLLLPDAKGWPRLAKPRSARHLAALLAAFFKGNVYHAWCVRKADALYVTSVNEALLNLLPAAWCRLTRRPVIHHFHDSGGDSRLLAAWSRLATDFIYNTEIGRQAIGRAHPSLARKRSAVLSYIIDAPSSRRRAGGDLATDDRRHVVYLGQVSEHKGVDLLVEAFGAVARHHPDALLDIVGGCTPEFEERFKSLCEHPDVAGRVKYWGYRADGGVSLDGAYLYVQPSPPSRCQESFGRSAVEAMAARVPVVCFRSGGLPEIVQDGTTGLVCDENVAALAAALDRMLRDRVFRDACAAASLRRYRACYSPEVVRPRWLAFFRTVV